MANLGEGYPLAAAISPRLQVTEHTGSTNAKLLGDAAEDAEGHPHLSVVLTTDQRAGRGRLGRDWTTPPGTALAVSVLLRVEAVEVRDRGWIPLVAGLAMARAIEAQLPSVEVGLKWPNDVLAGGRKISGILAEVLPSDPMVVVVGAGVNTRMDAVELPVPTATSFASLGRVADDDRLIADYLAHLRDLVAQLAVGGGAAVHDDVEGACLTVGQAVVVSLPDGTAREGVARRIDGEGRLVVDGAGGELVVAAGDVVHVR